MSQSVESALSPTDMSKHTWKVTCNQKTVKKAENNIDWLWGVFNDIDIDDDDDTDYGDAHCS